jgi:CRISPR-associated endoribonuclease Cas6/Csy4 subtype I-F
MTKSHYIDLRCGPPVNLGRAEIGHVMSALFHALHMARLNLKRDYPVAFAELEETPKNPSRKPLFIGSVIRVFGSPEDLSALLSDEGVRHFIDMAMAAVGGPQPVPPGTSTAIFQRVRRDDLSAGASDRKDRRTLARMAAGKSRMTDEALENRRNLDRLKDAQGPRYAYLSIPSLSTRQRRIPIFISKTRDAGASTGTVNSHGLSVGGYAVPDF